MKLKFRRAKNLYVWRGAPINVNYATSTTAMATSASTSCNATPTPNSDSTTTSDAQQLGGMATPWGPCRSNCTHACGHLSRSHPMAEDNFESARARAQRLQEISSSSKYTQRKWLLNAPICCRYRPQLRRYSRRGDSLSAWRPRLMHKCMRPICPIASKTEATVPQRLSNGCSKSVKKNIHKKFLLMILNERQNEWKKLDEVLENSLQSKCTIQTV